MKSFGNGVLLLRFQQEQTPESIASFASNLGSVVESVIWEPATDVFLMMEEGHPVTTLEARNTEDEWDELLEAVGTKGSEIFARRVSGLSSDRKSLSGAGSVAESQK